MCIQKEFKRPGLTFEGGILVIPKYATKTVSWWVLVEPEAPQLLGPLLPDHCDPKALIRPLSSLIPRFREFRTANRLWRLRKMLSLRQGNPKPLVKCQGVVCVGAKSGATNHKTSKLTPCLHTRFPEPRWAGAELDSRFRRNGLKN